ncbi:MAG: glycosyltransferase family 2 protein [Cyanobacteria bacterium P01_A01_bin.84]
MKFSVITPSYCQGRFIERTINSVLSQDISDNESSAESVIKSGIEYCVCDGGSNDETIEILHRYDKQIDWVSEPDKGQTDAVNKGISKTTGEIIAWINSDDIYYPGTFKAVEETFTANPEVEIIYGNADWIDENDRVIETFPTEPWNYQRLMETCYICQPAVFFKRNLVEKFGNLDSSLDYCMDYELWLRYGKQIKFYHLPRKLAGSRMYGSNKTLGQRLPAHQEICEMLQNKFGSIPDSWVLGYALVKVEETSKLNRFDDSQVRDFAKALISTSISEYHQRKQQVPLFIYLKMLFWFLFPNLSWFRRDIFKN